MQDPYNSLGAESFVILAFEIAKNVFYVIFTFFPEIFLPTMI